MIDWLDRWFSKSPGRRQAGILLLVACVSGSGGIWVGTRGLNDRMDELNAAIEGVAVQSQTADAAMRADIATNRSDVAAFRAILERVDLVRMAETVRRIDREVCLMRYDNAGPVTAQMQQECASR